MLPCTQSQQYLLPSNDNNPLFRTQGFRDFIKHLEYKNSLAALLRFVSSTSGVNNAIKAAPYVYVLHSNLKLSHDVAEILSCPQHGGHVRVWGSELFTRILSQLPEKQRASFRVPIGAIAEHFATKLQGNFKKSLVCGVYNTEYIDYVNSVLKNFSRGSADNLVVIDKNMIVETAQSILDEMVKHFSTADNRKFCLLLTFFGANFETNSLLSSDILREILLFSNPMACVPSKNISSAESTCRDTITSSLRNAITDIREQIEKTEAFAHRSYPWYRIFTKMKQVCSYYVTLPRLSHMFDIVRRLDTNYKTSISLGDCSEFFTSLEEVKSLMGNRKNECMNLLFSSLEKAHSSYRPIPHHEYVAEVRNCRESHITVPMHPIQMSFMGKLKQVKKKICSYFTRKKSTYKAPRMPKPRASNRIGRYKYSESPLNSTCSLDGYYPHERVFDHTSAGIGYDGTPPLTH
ncbi:MAG: hypothetical protein AB8U44_03290, partial [Aaplasma endosymbiont of Hyalomma asiaticum]